MAEIRSTKMTELEVTKAHTVASVELLEVEEAVRRLLRMPSEGDPKELDEKKKLQLAIGSIDRLCERIENMEIGLEMTIQEHATLVEQLRTKRKTLRQLFTTWTGGSDSMASELKKLDEALARGEIDEATAKERRSMLQQLKTLQEQKEGKVETGQELEEISAQMSDVVVELYEAEAEKLRTQLEQAKGEEAAEIQAKLHEVEEKLELELDNQKELQLVEAEMKETSARTEKELAVISPAAKGEGASPTIASVISPTAAGMTPSAMVGAVPATAAGAISPTAAGVISPLPGAAVGEDIIPTVSQMEKAMQDMTAEEAAAYREEIRARVERLEEVKRSAEEELGRLEERAREEQVEEEKKKEIEEESAKGFEKEKTSEKSSESSAYSVSVPDEDHATLADFEYLTRHVGKPLVEALVHCCLHSPRDNIQHIAGYLIFYRQKHELLIRKRRREDELQVQRQMVAARMNKPESQPPPFMNIEEEGYLNILGDDPYMRGMPNY